jgi:hypothetical protein
VQEDDGGGSSGELDFRLGFSGESVREEKITTEAEDSARHGRRREGPPSRYRSHANIYCVLIHRQLPRRYTLRCMLVLPAALCSLALTSSSTSQMKIPLFQEQRKEDGRKHSAEWKELYGIGLEWT